MKYQFYRVIHSAWIEISGSHRIRCTGDTSTKVKATPPRVILSLTFSNINYKLNDVRQASLKSSLKRNAKMHLALLQLYFALALLLPATLCVLTVYRCLIAQSQVEHQQQTFRSCASPETTSGWNVVTLVGGIASFWRSTSVMNFLNILSMFILRKLRKWWHELNLCMTKCQHKNKIEE